MWDEGSKGRDQGSEPRDLGSGIRAPGSGIRAQGSLPWDQESESKNWDQSNFLKIGTQLCGHRYFGRGERC